MIKARRGEISSLVHQHGELPVSELSKLLGVSEVTVRSDLQVLAGVDNCAARVVARLPLDVRGEAPLEETRHRHADAKRRIGRAAAALVQDNETIFLDVGSSTTEVARALLSCAPQRHCGEHRGLDRAGSGAAARMCAVIVTRRHGASPSRRSRQSLRPGSARRPRTD